MAFPKFADTPRGRELRTKFELEENLHLWPTPTANDHSLIGAVVVLFGYIDFNLRRLAELFDEAGMVPTNWLGKTPRLNMADAAAAVQASDVWKAFPNAVGSLQEIEEHRALRNFLAHCAIRRFPADDALLFIFKSRRDYKEMYGDEPPTFTALGAGVDCEVLRKAIERVEELQNWLAETTADLENRIELVSL